MRLTARQKATLGDQAIHILGGNVNVTSRWTNPVRFAVVRQQQETAYSEVARQVMRAVADTTALPVTFVDSEYQSVPLYIEALQQSRPYRLLPCRVLAECANFVVVITDVAMMRDIAQAVPLREVYIRTLTGKREAVCFFSPFQKASVIHQAMVFVRQDLSAEMISTCLHEEIYQSFGLFNDYTDSEYFSFNNRVIEKEITRYDRALLKTVYQYPPGTAAFVIVKAFMDRIESMQ